MRVNAIYDLYFNKPHIVNETYIGVWLSEWVYVCLCGRCSHHRSEHQRSLNISLYPQSNNRTINFTYHVNFMNKYKPGCGWSILPYDTKHKINLIRPKMWYYFGLESWELILIRFTYVSNWTKITNIYLKIFIRILNMNVLRWKTYLGVALAILKFLS